MEKKYHSITHGTLTEQGVYEQIEKDLIEHPGSDYLITVGTDSQTYSKTKIVTVIALHQVGKGGKFFYSVEYLAPIHNIRQKVYDETARSIELSKRMTDYLYEHDLDFDIVIHVDIGRSRKGKTAELIQEIMGWVNAEGFVCHHKPDSYTASTIADRISK